MTDDSAYDDQLNSLVRLRNSSPAEATAAIPHSNYQVVLRSLYIRWQYDAGVRMWIKVPMSGLGGYR